MINIGIYTFKKETNLKRNTSLNVSVANEAMRGASAADAAYIMQWVEFADSEILPASCTWVFPCMGIMQFNKQVAYLTL